MTTRAVFEALASDLLAAAVALRWVGGLHLLALRGLQPWAQLWRSAALLLMHSVVWQYIAADEQHRITAAMHAAASRATAAAPLAWLRFEPASMMGDVELRCQIWPEGTDHLLARCHPHGAHVHWLHSP